MKRKAVVLAALVLFLTACSRQAVQDVFKGPGSGVNMLEIRIGDQTFDLGQNTADVLDSMYNAGLTVFDYQTLMQFGAGGRPAAKDERVKVWEMDRNKLVYFHSFPSAYWKMYEGSEKAVEYGIPQNGVEASVYGFPYWSGEMSGVLGSFASADGLTKSSGQTELTGYLYTGTYGMSMSSADRNVNSHYIMVAVDGKPLDLSSYVEALPASLPEEMYVKGGTFIISSPFMQASSANAEQAREEIRNDYASTQECRNFCAVINAYSEKIKEVNNRTINNLTLIDLAFVGGRFESAAYFVFKVDAFNPR